MMAGSAKGSGEKGIGGQGEIRVRLIDVNAGKLSGFKYELVCHFKFTTDMVRGNIKEFVYDVDSITEKEADRIWCGWIPVGQSSQSYKWPSAHSYLSYLFL